jgi:transcriptional regulator with XRE-family HTH domain
VDPAQLLLGRAVREVRKAQGLTQKQVAERTGVHVTYLSDVERGARNPSWKVIASLAAGMGVPTADIAGRYDALAAGRKGATSVRGSQNTERPTPGA